MPMTRLTRNPLSTIAATLAVLIVAGLFGAFHPAFDSIGHLRAQFGALLILVCALLLPRRPMLAVAGIAVGLAAIATTLPAGLLPGARPVEAAESNVGGPTYKLMQLNLRYDNPEPEKVLSLIAREWPDVVTLDEISAQWEPKLALLKGVYPHQINCRERRFGSGIISRRPFSPDKLPRCFDRGSMAVASVDFRGTKIDVAALHLGWPWPFDQDWQLGQLKEPLGGLADPAILGGDFNATPWSAATARVAASSGMTQAPSIGPTWLHYGLPRQLRFAGLEIDHVLAKGGVELRGVRRLDDVGSDHWPVLAEFGLKPKLGEEPARETVQAEPDAAPSRLAAIP